VRKLEDSIGSKKSAEDDCRHMATNHLPLPTFLSMGRSVQPPSLARAVAAHLWSEVAANGSGIRGDFSGWELWVPTGGAGRRIRHALAQIAAEEGVGVISPRVVQPMQAMLPLNPRLLPASRVEREAAWGMALRDLPNDQTDLLLPAHESLSSEDFVFSAGAVLCSLCDLLAEAGLEPTSKILPEIREEDAGRWVQLARVYRSYVTILTGAERSDPNVLRLSEMRDPCERPGLRHVVIVCIPDLPRISENYASALRNRGIQVEVLVAGGAWRENDFDSWGRPRFDVWSSYDPGLSENQILVAASLREEACLALDSAASACPPGDYAIFVTDSSVAGELAEEIRERGGDPYLPDSKAICAREAGVLSMLWGEWRKDKSLRVLRQLLQHSAFSKWMEERTSLNTSEQLSACDFLLAEAFLSHLDEATEFLGEKNVSARSSTRDFAGILVHAMSDSGADTNALFPEGMDPMKLDAGLEVLQIFCSLEQSPIFRTWPSGRDLAFQRMLRSERSGEGSRAGQVELSGWLEAPWSEASRLILSGCVEGNLPSSETGHPFLPDSTRAGLGLPDAASRRSRDAYWLATLAELRSEDNFFCSFSRLDATDSPTIPSSLFFRCQDQTLARRVKRLFTLPALTKTRPVRSNHWRWHLPEKFRQRPVKISATDFQVYLSCPLRFYFQRVLSSQSVNPLVRELDSRQFGSLIHKTVEWFGRNLPNEMEKEEIFARLEACLKSLVAGMFGPHPPPAIYVQWEAAKVRLRAFAALQAQEAEKGWKILHVERRLTEEESAMLQVGGLPLRAVIDRIEEHPEHGIRVVDYKTFARGKTPVQSHLGSASPLDLLPESKLEYAGKQKAWMDLQLPLYHRIAKHWYPGQNVSTAYFLLPADPDQSAIKDWPELEDCLDSALGCAEVVAEKIRRGVFWPPRGHKSPWEDPLETWLVNGAPEDSFDQDTIAFLKGDL
jgi:ATP-dependent helicase/nuclease subunit B